MKSPFITLFIIFSFSSQVSAQLDSLSWSKNLIQTLTSMFKTGQFNDTCSNCYDCESKRIQAIPRLNNNCLALKLLDTLYSKDSLIQHLTFRIDSAIYASGSNDSIRFKAFTLGWYKRVDELNPLLGSFNGGAYGGFLIRELEWLHIMFDAKIYELKALAKSLYLTN